jgi:hypothetical protein
LRTASRPPRTLIEVASYLCPPAGEAGPPAGFAESLSGMSRASPQTKKTLGSENPERTNSFSGRRSRGKVLDTCPPRRACLYHWSRSIELGRRAKTRRVLPAASRPIPNHGRTRRSRFFLPLARAFVGCDPADFGALVLAASGPAEAQFPTNKVPYRRNLEHGNLTGLPGNSQGDYQVATVAYVA